MQFRFAGPRAANLAPDATVSKAGGGFELRQANMAPESPHLLHKVDTLQGMRAIAALAVAFYHTHVILSMPEYGGLDVLAATSGFGWLGVNFFFVLSGFIILFAHGKEIGKPQTIRNYFWRRFVRVYPVYWIFLSLFIVAAMKGFGSHDIQFSGKQMFSVYSLFPVMNAPPLPLKVAWTLMIEVKFYLVFAVLLASRRVGVAVMLLWALAIVARNCMAPPPDFAEIWPDYGMLSIWNLYFLCGMLACLAIPQIPSVLGPIVLAAGVALVIYTASDAPGQEFAMRMPPLLTKFAIAFGMVIAGAVICERRYNWRLPKLALLLGDASYSIYLVHSAVLSLVAQIYHKFAFGALPPLVIFFAAFVLAVGVGVGAHLFLEKPLLGLLRRQKSAPRVDGPGRATDPGWISLPSLTRGFGVRLRKLHPSPNAG
jgi:exopolysaccharide production protein ExoZ